jgi:hypothetical protein
MEKRFPFHVHLLPFSDIRRYLISRTQRTATPNYFNLPFLASDSACKVVDQLSMTGR